MTNGIYVFDGRASGGELTPENIRSMIGKNKHVDLTPKPPLHHKVERGLCASLSTIRSMQYVEPKIAASIYQKTHGAQGKTIEYTLTPWWVDLELKLAPNPPTKNYSNEWAHECRTQGGTVDVHKNVGVCKGVPKSKLPSLKHFSTSSGTMWDHRNHIHINSRRVKNGASSGSLFCQKARMNEAYNIRNKEGHVQLCNSLKRMIKAAKNCKKDLTTIWGITNEQVKKSGCFQD